MYMYKLKNYKGTENNFLILSIHYSIFRIDNKQFFFKFITISVYQKVLSKVKKQNTILLRAICFPVKCSGAHL